MHIAISVIPANLMAAPLNLVLLSKLKIILNTLSIYEFA
jgi:hypothetical protein